MPAACFKPLKPDSSDRQRPNRPPSAGVIRHVVLQKPAADAGQGKIAKGTHYDWKGVRSLWLRATKTLDRSCRLCSSLLPSSVEGAFFTWSLARGLWFDGADDSAENLH